MKSMNVCLIVGFLLAGAALATPSAAMRIQRSWEARVAEWGLRYKAAVTDEQRARLMEEMPDAQAALNEMWQVIGQSLAEEWTLEPAAWFMRTGAGITRTGGDGVAVAVFSRNITAVRDAVDKHHRMSGFLRPMCEALAATPNPQSLAILEKVAAENPHQKIQGVAALGAAILLGKLGDDPHITQKRITNLKKAIIQSADVAFGSGTVADVAKEELYVINNLTKGREAPDLTGSDSAGRDLRLSDFRGKVVYLVFWSSRMQERERVLRMVAETRRRFAGKPVEVVGVNIDPTATLRGMEADGSVTWRNFSDPGGALATKFRAVSLPLVYVLDGGRRIRYSGMPGSFADLTCDALLANREDPATK